MFGALFSTLLGSDNGISQTVAKIKQGIYFALHEPQQRIRKRAEVILRDSNLPERNEKEEIKGLYDWVKAHFHYAHDPAGIEYVKSPEVSDDEISKYGQFIGDCDDATAYLAALFSSIGYNTRLVVITDQRSPHDEFQHIYLRVYSPRMGRWISVDPTAKRKPFGWNATAKRLREYDV